MIIFNKNKLISSESNCIGVVGDNKAYTQEFYIKGIADASINYTLHLRFADGSVNSVIPDTVSFDRDVTMLRWIVKKNDIYMHGYFEVQIEGVNSTGLVFQTEIVRMYADESIPIEDNGFVNLNSENLRLREEAYEMVKKLDDFSGVLEETDVTTIESTNNKVTEFASNFEDKENKKYPTITALMKYLKDYYYDLLDIDDMVESMHIDDEGNLSITLPYCGGEKGETLIIGKVSGKDGVDGVGIASTSVKTSAVDCGINAITFNLTNGKSTTFTVLNGSKGSQGYTPVKGTDYWTDSDKTEIIGEVNETISVQLADLTQVEPNFVNSIEECTDTSKVYVLPDGYIYGYLIQKGKAYTDLIPTAVAPDSDEVYNGIGYKVDTYISGSSGHKDSSGSLSTATGLISVENAPNGVHSEIYVKGSTMSADNTECRVTLYDSDKAIITQRSFSTGYFTYEELGDNYFKFKLEQRNDGVSDAVYFAIVFNKTDNVPVVAFEEITDDAVVESQEWANTGHAFVPADYEDRILALEEKSTESEITVNDIDERLTEIENIDISGVPSYVKYEADRVVDLLLDKITENSLVSAHFSDVHYFYSSVQAETLQALEHTGMGISEISKVIKLDYVADHGDNDTDENATKTKNASKIINYNVNCEKIKMIGNHDVIDKAFTESQLYAHFGIHNTHCVLDEDNTAGIYGYKDFEHCKMRVVFLNTSDVYNAETEVPSCAMVSPKQMKWLINKALDFSDKENATEWGIQFISHIPLNWDVYLPQVLNVIDGYIDSSSGTVTADGETISYDFTNGDKAEVIMFTHGHTHNFRVGYLGTHNILSMAIPQVCPDRYNEYGTTNPTLGGELDENGNPVYYYKTADTAESTSFVVNVIDRVNRKIHSIHYGAGIDREFDY